MGNFLFSYGIYKKFPEKNFFLWVDFLYSYFYLYYLYRDI